MVWPFDVLEERIRKLEHRLANTEGQLADLNLSKIQKTLEAIMSKISEYGDAVRGYFTDMQASFSDLNTGLSDLTNDIAAMKALIEKLQNSPGEITPEDQKTLDDLQALTKSVADNAKSAAAVAKQLDEQTPPPNPPAG